MSRFYVCKHCGNLVGLIHDAGVSIKCCGENMVELVANTTDAAQEKHVPVVSVSGQSVSVCVGSVEHPMAEDHSIEWVYLETEKGGQRKAFAPGDAPKADFVVENDKPVAVYAYCNLHGLWKAEL